MARLFGRFNHNLEQKNRLAIPAKLRSELGKSFVLTVSTSERCLRAYTFEDWDFVMEKLNDQPSSEELTTIQRLIYMKTVSVSLDKYGRISIPIEYLEEVGIEHEVFMLGTGFHLELWSPEEYKKMEQKTMEDMKNKKVFLNK